MIEHWIATFEWAGNLKLLPELPDMNIVGYAQLNPGHIRVSMLCTKASLIRLAYTIIDDYCINFHVEPVITLRSGTIIAPKEYEGRDVSAL